ncbi:MAG: DUF1697 domain-containing protein [Acidimicrobiia bacterium]|nr:MAG: DUF1697 domain-containing protein [Acidimicrobiia bacterium]
MPRHVAFLRAINTPGRNVKMDRLQSAFVALGMDNVETFIASGNVIFDSDGADLTGRIEAALKAEVGFSIPVYLRTADEVIAAADSHPFGDTDGEVEISFLPTEPDPEDVVDLVGTATGSDRLAVVGRELYWLHSGPRSESDHREATVVKILGMPTTQRSARTVQRIADKYLR